MVKQGRILKGIGGFYYVEAEETIYECKARGVFRKRGTTPLAGDWVQVCIDNDTGTIEEIFPRKNMLVRPPCANIDQMFLVTSVCNPSPNLLVLDKMIAVAEDQEMEPILVISKTDLQSADELEQIYQKAGIQVITVSSVSGQGIERIQTLLKDKISVFTGNSGVGKSSLLNCISPEFQQGQRKAYDAAGRIIKIAMWWLCGRYTWVFYYGYGTLQHCKKRAFTILLQRDETLYYTV